MPAHRAPVELLDEHVHRERRRPDEEPGADRAEVVIACEQIVNAAEGLLDLEKVVPVTCLGSRKYC